MSDERRERAAMILAAYYPDDVEAMITFADEEVARDAALAAQNAATPDIDNIEPHDYETALQFLNVAKRERDEAMRDCNSNVLTFANEAVRFSKIEQDWLKAELARLKTIFRVNMLKYCPNVTHEEIDEAMSKE